MHVTVDKGCFTEELVHLRVEHNLRGYKVEKIELEFQDMRKLASMTPNEIHEWAQNVASRFY